VLGTPWYLYDFVEGLFLKDPLLPDVKPCDRRPVYFAMARTLAELHAVNPTAVGLGDFGRADGFLSRRACAFAPAIAWCGLGWCLLFFGGNGMGHVHGPSPPLCPEAGLGRAGRPPAAHAATHTH
jgi:hypothetical protein